MNQCIGTCSICGGQVVAYMGAWMGIMPPPPPTCSQCGAVAAGSAPQVIPMVPAPTPFTPNVGSGFVPGAGFTWPPRTTTSTGMPMPDGKWRA